jgi:hypothetical protein
MFVTLKAKALKLNLNSFHGHGEGVDQELLVSRKSILGKEKSLWIAK